MGGSKKLASRNVVDPFAAFETPGAPEGFADRFRLETDADKYNRSVQN